MTRDPLGYGGGINLYSYTQNSPINGSDSSGFGKRLKEHECLHLFNKIVDLVDEMKRQFSNMENDYQGQYPKRDFPWPKCNSDDGTNWYGHQQNYDSDQDDLKDAIRDFMDGCGDRFQLPQDAKFWKEKPFPNAPSKYADYTYDDGFWVPIVFAPPIFKGAGVIVDGAEGLLGALGKGLMNAGPVLSHAH